MKSDSDRKHAGEPAAPAKPGLHPRNRHRHGYDFAALVAATPSLARFLKTAPSGQASIDFANPAAVKALNRALLRSAYDVAGWALPDGYLCPPIPGRADYLHHLADLLAAENGGAIPRGAGVHVLDIGVGANGVYPLIGQHDYGWSFVGADIDAPALAALQKVLDANPQLAGSITLRHQAKPEAIFAGIVGADERFDLSLCNPPFHASRAEAEAGTRRKLNALARQSGRPAGQGKTLALNFGGQGHELICPGGEAGFVARMIDESAAYGRRCLWFTSLLAKEASLPAVQKALARVGVREQRIVGMTQGQKKSRFVAWTFLDAAAHARWRAERWVAKSGAV